MAKPEAAGDSRAGAGQILRAALDAFEEEGFHGTSIRSIAARAGVSIALIYYHFPSKEEILRTIMLRVTNELLDDLRAARAAAGPAPAEQIAALVRVHVRFHTVRQSESFVGNTELRSLGGAARDEVVASRDAISELYREIVAAGLADGSFHTDVPAEAVMAILNMCTSVANWYRAEGRRSADELAEIYVRFALDLLGGKQA